MSDRKIHYYGSQMCSSFAETSKFCLPYRAVREFYQKYLQTTFPDEEQERNFQETFQRDSLKNMGKVTFCTLFTAMLNLWLFIRIAYFSPYTQLPIIKTEGINAIILNTVWIVYSLLAYFLHRRFQQCNWMYGCIHYVILIV